MLANHPFDFVCLSPELEDRHMTSRDTASSYAPDRLWNFLARQLFLRNLAYIGIASLHFYNHRPIYWWQINSFECITSVRHKCLIVGVSMVMRFSFLCSILHADMQLCTFGGPLLALIRCMISWRWDTIFVFGRPWTMWVMGSEDRATYFHRRHPPPVSIIWVFHEYWIFS